MKTGESYLTAEACLDNMPLSAMQFFGTEQFAFERQVFVARNKTFELKVWKQGA